MGLRPGPGARRAVRIAGALRRIGAGLLVGWLIATPAWGETPRPQPLAHQAVVLNGELVGSAFAIAPGIALTNAHVVKGRRVGQVVVLVGPQTGRPRSPARILALSSNMDLAVLEVPKGFLPTVSQANAVPRIGSALLAAGVDAAGGARLPRLAASGRVLRARHHVAGFGPGLVARMPGVRPGFSGGPVFDAEGRLAGMIAAIRPGREQGRSLNRPASGFAPSAAGRHVAREAFILGARDIRAEAARLLAAAGR